MPEDDRMSKEEIDFWNDEQDSAIVNQNLEILNESANTETLYHSYKGSVEKETRDEK